MNDKTTLSDKESFHRTVSGDTRQLSPELVTARVPKRYQCPHCNAVLETDDDIDGMQVECPACGQEFVAQRGVTEDSAGMMASLKTALASRLTEAKKLLASNPKARIGLGIGAAALVGFLLCQSCPSPFVLGRKAGTTKTITLPGGASMEMVWCPPGTFTMGRPDGEAWRDPREWGPSWKGYLKNIENSPYNLHKSDDDQLELMRVWGFPEGENDREDWETQHSVTLTKGFWMARTEVTQAQWESVMGNNPSSVRGDDRLPVDNVSWDDCVLFCQKAGLQLPTEAQWEYACRAGTDGPYGGTGDLDDMGWYRGNCHAMHPVGTKMPNAWGLCDMHGNVDEWCADGADIHLSHSGKSVTNPKGSGAGKTRIIRGGSYANHAVRCRSAFRFNYFPKPAEHRGFRPVLMP